MGTRILNLISLLASIATVFVIIGVIVLVLTPTAEQIEAANTLPTVVSFPTEVPSASPTATSNRPTLPPTFTETPTTTFTPTPTFTLTSTITPSPTITTTPRDTDTPTVTFTPSISPTIVPTATATGPTATLPASVVPYPFILRESITFVPNSFNTLGCSWQGVGGQVVDSNGNPFGEGSLQVHVFSNDGNVDRIVLVGSSTLFNSQASWEAAVDTTVNNRTYFVQLETNIGTQISPTYNMTFPQDCNRNAAIVNFISNPTFGA